MDCYRCHRCRRLCSHGECGVKRGNVVKANAYLRTYFISIFKYLQLCKLHLLWPNFLHATYDNIRLPSTDHKDTKLRISFFRQLRQEQQQQLHSSDVLFSYCYGITTEICSKHTSIRVKDNATLRHDSFTSVTQCFIFMHIRST